MDRMERAGELAARASGGTRARAARNAKRPAYHRSALPNTYHFLNCAMPLPTSEEELRALDAQLSSRTSAAYKRTLASLLQAPLQTRIDLLQACVFSDSACFARCVLDAGVSVDSLMGRESEGWSVLCHAVTHGSHALFRALLEAGADKGLRCRDGSTVLHVAARNAGLPFLTTLLAAGADPHAVDFVGNTPLIDAVIRKRPDNVRALLPVSNPLTTAVSGRTALHIAANGDNEECMSLLLEVVDVDVRTGARKDGQGERWETAGDTALHLAAMKGLQQIAKVLLKKGANRMAVNSKLFTPLHWAAHNGNWSMCQLLVGRPDKVKISPSQVDAQDVDGATALHMGAFRAELKVCGVLLAAGASLETKDSTGLTPLKLAQHFHPHNAALLALLSGQGPPQLPGTVCDHCSKTTEQAGVGSFKTCTSCQAARYCGKTCQVAAWAGHKAACKACKAVLERIVKPDVVSPV